LTEPFGTGSRNRVAPLSVLHVVAPGAVGGLEAVVQALAIGALGSGVRAVVATVTVSYTHLTLPTICSV